MLGRQLLQFGNQVEMATQGEIDVHPFFDGGDPALGKSVPFGVQPRTAQTLARHSPPEPQSLVQ